MTKDYQETKEDQIKEETTKKEQLEKEELNQNQEDQIKEEAIEDLKENEKLANLEDKIKQAEEKYIRSLAESENMRRRYEKMISDSAKYAVSDFAKETISILDIFNKAFSGIKEEEIEDASFKNFLVGIKLTKKQLEKTISKFGIEKVGKVGEAFDPNFHEALYSKPLPDQENDTICEIMEEGYKIHDRLLRSAKVGIVRNN